MIREIRSDRDLAAYAEVWSAISPRDAVSADFVQGKLAREPERLYLLAEDGDRVIGCGLTSGSNFAGRKFVLVGVVRDRRRRGLGTELLELCLAHARSLAGEAAVSFVWEDCDEALAFVARHGFAEYERGAEYMVELDGKPAPPPPPGIEIVELTPEHYPGAYEIWIEGAADAPHADPPSPMPYERWLSETGAKELVLVAVEAGEVVGFAALEDRNRAEGAAGNDLTTVCRSHRRRGIAEALKREQLARAADLGYVTVVTGQHEDNVGMRHLNEKLGYRPLPATIMVRRPLGA
jgi:GNAT superfamily N-acetyltransferase